MLNENTTLIDSGVTFSSTVNGAKTLAVTGNAVFANAVGNSTEIRVYFQKGLFPGSF